MLGGNELQRLAAGLPDTTLLVHDGAYAEFEEGFDGGASLVDAFANVVMTRTFSKIHGLGGLRIGWGYARREVVDVLNRIRQPFNLSTAQLSAAEAAIRDTGFAAWCRAENVRLREWLRIELARAGVPTDDSHTNFVLARFRDGVEADACDAHLRADGIIVRRVAGYGLPQCLRMTVGDEAGTRRLALSVAAFMEGRR
jgi:histidinol-phosphate aminotransferase